MVDDDEPANMSPRLVMKQYDLTLRGTGHIAVIDTILDFFLNKKNLPKTKES